MSNVAGMNKSLNNSLRPLFVKLRVSGFSLIVGLLALTLFGSVLSGLFILLGGGFIALLVAGTVTGGLFWLVARVITWGE